MKPNVNHHMGMRVADLEKGIDFYRNVFDAELIAAPFPIDGEFAEMVTAGPAGVNWRVAILRIGDGVIELFEFGHPRLPITPTEMTEDNILHFTIEVDDVPATLERIEAEGGRRLWPEVVDLAPDAQVIYAVDPDENAIELLDVSIDGLVKLMIETHPEAEPASWGGAS